MKKIAGKIAMILILVMLANSFSSCTLMLPALYSGNDEKTEKAIETTGIIIDVVLVLVLSILFFGGMTGGFGEAPNETGIYLANSEHDPLTDYYSVMEFLNSLPETERAAVMEKINSLPEAKLDALVSTVASLPQAEVTASIERLNALSEAELVSTIQDLTALSETEFDLLADKINEKVRSLPIADYVALVAVSP